MLKFFEDFVLQVVTAVVTRNVLIALGFREKRRRSVNTLRCFQVRVHQELSSAMQDLVHNARKDVTVSANVMVERMRKAVKVH